MKDNNLLYYLHPRFTAKMTLHSKKIWLNQGKLFIWKTFFDLEKWFIWTKWNLFDSNKVSLDQIKICSNQINFCLKSNKSYLWPYINTLIYLSLKKIILFKQIFIWVDLFLYFTKKEMLKFNFPLYFNFYPLY